MCRRREAGGTLGVRRLTRLWQERSQQEKEDAMLVIAETGGDFLKRGFLVCERKEEFRMVNAGMCPGCWVGFRFQEGGASIWLGAANRYS